MLGVALGAAAPVFAPAVRALALSGLVSPAQAAIVAALPTAVVRALVASTAVPLQAADSDGEARRKLLAAVWAGEAARSVEDVRRLQDPEKADLLQALGAASVWATAVQDGYLVATLDLCRQAPWVRDTTLSQGLLSIDRMASLALLASLQSPAKGGANPRARLALTLSDAELKTLESSLAAAGHTFADITWVGNSWSVSAPVADSPSTTTGAGGSSVSGYARSCVTWGSGLSSVSHQGQPAGGRTALVEEQYLTLAVDVFALFTDGENSNFKNRAKFGASGTPGRKRELAHPGAEDRSSATESLPLAQFPWNQVFTLQESLALSMWGRILRVALSFWNEHITDPMTGLVHGRMHDQQLFIWNTFQEAARCNDLSQALITVPAIVRYATVRMLAVHEDSQTRAAAHPTSALFRHVAQQRAAQEASVAAFMDGVSKRITREAGSAPGHNRAVCSVLMWQEFLGGWMSASFSATHCEDLQAKWQRMQQSEPVGSGPQRSGAGLAAATTPPGGTSPSAGGAGGDGGTGRAGTAGGGTPAGGSLGRTQQEFRRTIPLSIDVLGNTLGVVQTFVCKNCKPLGRMHHSSECPQRWSKAVGSPMPGFLANGTRDETQWKQRKEPIKATIRAWIALLTDPTPWNGMLPITAGVSGAPNLEDFQRQLALAPEKP